MINKNIIQAIKDKEMDRKDFLKYSGLVLLSLVGLKTVISIFMQSDDQKTFAVAKSQNKATHGFGGGRYGA